MFKKTLIKSLLCSILIGSMAAISTPAMATSEAMLNLLKILRDKGSITADEYAALEHAAKADGEQVDKIASEAKANVKEVTEKLSWAEKIKIKGDVRLRYQQDFDHNTTDPKDRGRGRVRARAGIIATPTDSVEAGIGMASGGSDLRSTNQSFEGTFDTKGWNLDYAFAKWEPAQVDGLSVIGGKYYWKDWFWQTTDIAIDKDITFEGGSLNYKFKNSLGETFANAGFWIADENSTADDPRIYYAQGGHKFKFGDAHLKVGGTYFSLDGNRAELLTSAGGAFGSDNNTTTQFGEIYGASFELGTKTKFLGAEKVAIFGDFWTNESTGVTSNDTAIAIGAKIGSKKVKKKGTWEAKYIGGDIAKNAFLDMFPDSDRAGGATGVASHEFEVKYAFMDNWTVGVDYYNTNNYTDNKDEDLVQADLVFSF